MAFFTSKLGIGILVVLAFLILLYMLGKKSVHTEIQINASPSAVWSALSNLDEVRSWNKVLIPIDGELAVGSSVNYEFYQEEGGKPASMPGKVLKLEKEKLINQAGGMTGILTFNHQYIIEPAEGGCTVTIHEEYRGLMVPFWNPAPVEKAYARLLQSLKAHVERQD